MEPDPSIERFFALTHIAFVGASRDSKEFANQVYRQLRAGGRTLHPVHPDRQFIEGDPCVHAVAELPDDVGGIIVMLDAERALPVVRAAIDRGIGMVWLHRGIGHGAESADAIAACREAGVTAIVGCPLMFAEPVAWFHRAHRAIAKPRIAA